MSPKTLARVRRRAVIYARVSKGAPGKTVSVPKQIDHCKAIVENHEDWELGPVITDDAISASRYSTKDRPGYRELLQVLREGDILVVWEQSRSARKLEEWVELRKLCEALGVLLCSGGQVLDLSNPRDRLSTGVKAVFDEHESDVLQGRIRETLDKNLALGRPSGAPPFGYRIIRDSRGRPTTRITDDGRELTWEPDPEEAPIFQELVRRYLDRETFRSIRLDFRRRGIVGHRGAPMEDVQLKRMLRSPTYAGYRVHRGRAHTRGTWEPLIDEVTHHKIVARLADKGQPKGHGSQPVHLLSGLIKCPCGSTMKRFRTNKIDIYRCRAAIDKAEGAGQGHSSRKMEFVDEVVVQTFLGRLESGDFMRLVLGGVQSDSTRHDAYIEQAQGLERYLQGYIASAADPESGVTPQALGAIEREIRPKIDELYRQAAKAEDVGVPDDLRELMLSSDKRKHWDGWPLEVKREIIGRYLEITVLPAGGPTGARRDPSLIKIKWKEPEI